MKNTIKKIGAWIWEHKKLLLMLTLGTALVLHPDLVQAAGTSSGTSGDNSETVKSLGELANLLVRFLNTLLWPLLLIIGDLLDVDMITGPGMEERLIAIWVEMRNLVNIAIALFLIVVAFYNVLGLGGGEGELAIKTALPKVVLGLLLVNFTYVGGKVILDAANVGTTIAFSLPQIMEDNAQADFTVDDQLETFEEDVCYPAPTVVEKGADGEAGTSDDVTERAYYSKDDAPIQTKLFCELLTTDSTESEALADQYDGIRSSLHSLYFSNLNKNNIAIVMAVNMGSLGSLELLKVDAVKDFKDLTVNTIFALVMYTIFAISYVVLAVVLVVRLIVLWLALALSPLAVLIYVVPQLKEWLGGGGGDFTQKVVKHLVAPIIIGLTLSMGFLLMDAWSVVAQGSFSSYGDTKVSDVISTEFLVSGIDDLPKLILAIASVAVIWMGVFAAANDTYAQAVTGKIQEFGGKVGGAIMQAPLVFGSLPISVSGEDKQGMSPMAFKTILTGALDQFNNGAFVNDELERYKGNAIVDFSLGRSGGDRNPTRSATEMQDFLSKARMGESITRDEAAQLAGQLADTVRASTTMKSGDRDSMVRELEDLQADLAEGRAPTGGDRALEKIISRYESKKDEKGENYTAEDFGALDNKTNGLEKARSLSIMSEEESKRSTRERESNEGSSSSRTGSDKGDDKGKEEGDKSSGSTSTKPGDGAKAAGDKPESEEKEDDKGDDKEDDDAGTPDNPGSNTPEKPKPE